MLIELDNRIPIPKTRAGQFFKEEDQTVIRERLTSYGSMAIVRLLRKYIVVYHDFDAKSICFTNCGINVRLMNSLWCEIV